MALKVSFEPASIGRNPAEDACLGLVDGDLMTVLVRLDADETASAPRWYLETGFGPCAREGLIFATLDAAATWIRDQLR